MAVEDKTADDKMIEYLSKEIETHTNSLMTFRERINFAVFIGPFALLGATLYATGFLHVNWDGITPKGWFGICFSLVAVSLCYLAMGVACYRIEAHIWDQCNKWRERIAEISRGDRQGFARGELEFEHYLRMGYLFVYIVMILASGSAILLVLILAAHTPGK